MPFVTGRQRRWFFANNRGINLQRRLTKRIKVYGGFNPRIGFYGGVVGSNSHGLKINPRANMRYGPSVKVKQNLSNRVSAQGVVAPHKFDVNITSKSKRGNYVKAGYGNTSGPYIGTGNRKIGMGYLIRKKKLNLQF